MPDRRLSDAPPAEPPPVAGTAREDWIRAYARKYKLRTIDWATQSVALLRAPRRFMEEWATGRRDALTPPRLFAFGMAVQYLVEKAGRRIVHISAPTEAWLGSLVHSAFSSMILGCLFGGAMHLVLRTRRKAPLHVSLAATLYAAGGPQVLLALAGWAFTLVVFAVRGKIGPLTIQINKDTVHAVAYAMPTSVAVASAASVLWTIAAMAGAHRVSRRWAAVAVVGAFLLMALFMAFFSFLAAFIEKRFAP